MSAASRSPFVRTVVAAVVVVAALAVPSTSIPQGTPMDLGQTATRLPSGQWLVAGGVNSDGPTDTLLLVDLATGTTTPATGGLKTARAHHTATLLPDGTVLIVGGVGRDGQVVAEAEIYRPETGALEVVATPGLLPRAHHTATVLTDGRVLVAGGTTDGQHPRGDAQFWHPRTGAAEALTSIVARQDHTATLLADGTVLVWGGIGPGGTALAQGEQLDPIRGTATPVPAVPAGGAVLSVAASLPADGATDVPTDALIAIRLSTPPRLASVNAGTVTLTGPAGLEEARLVPTEGGMLLFLTPRVAPRFATAYTVRLDGVTDDAGVPMPPTRVRFTTAGAGQNVAPLPTDAPGGTVAGLGSEPTEASAREAADADDETGPWRGERRDGHPYSRWQALPPLPAGPDVTALAGQVLRLNGEPLADVTLVIQPQGTPAVRARTDATGRFLLEPVGTGHQQLLIDGRSASTRGRRYGIFEVGVDVEAGQTNALPYTIWLPALDTAHAVRIASPTTEEIVVTTPKLPGLEVHLPAGTVIRDHEGQVVREVSITPVPLDRPPFPLPKGVDVPFYFTVQPGAAYLTNATYRGARLIYPSTEGVLPGTRVNFWNYDAGGRGWYVYGLGTALPDGGGIVPDPKVSVYEFTGAMVAGPGQKPASGAPPGSPAKGGDPVDLVTGLFVLEKTDLALPDVLPLVLKRTYRPGDTWSRAFGLGTSHPYDMFLVGDTFPYTYMDLVLPDGGSIHYVRISPGTSFEDAVMETTATPTRFYKSRIAWNGAQFFLTLKDGTVYTFREAFGATRPMQGGLLSIRDRNGNTLTMTRNADGDLTRITTPGGRWVDFTYDGSHRVTQAKDVLGRTVNYAYDSGGRLTTVTDPAGGVTSYTYDSSNRMVTLTDARGILFLTNEYDSTGKVTQQTQADGTTYQFAYTLGSGGKVTQTDVTDPRGNIRRVTFNSDGYTLTDTGALGTPIAQTTTYVRQAGSSLPTAITDALGRRTDTTYDAKGNALTVTRLAGTPNAVTTTYTYEPTFSQLATITNALNQTTTFGYDAQGNLTSVTDPLNHGTTLSYNGRGQPVTVASPLGHVTTLTYDLSASLATIADPLGNTTARAYDTAGRLIRQTTPGTATAIGYDALNRVTAITDAKQGVTAFTYDANGNLLTLTDARGNTTSYTYDSMDRVTTRMDPLGHSESSAYDPIGNLSQRTDRKGQVATFTYDALNRRTVATYADATVGYTLDAAGRPTQITDSVGGTITNAYDTLDRLTSQATALGTVGYAYDALGRRTQMTAPNQSPVAYAYDAARRLTSITQGSSVVQFAYDATNRRTSLMLPNGITTQYAYDAASQLTGLTYALGTTVLGDLQYTYDVAGNRVQVGGSWARTSIPQPVTSATYNANSQQLMFDGQSFTYDLNGNLTGDGPNTYSWDARNRLMAITGPLAASFVYDAAVRRSRKTIDGVATDFLYDGLNPVQEHSGQTTTNLLTGRRLDEHFSRSDAISTGFYLTDALGSAVVLVDGSGSLRTTHTYEPFGTTITTGAPNPYDFTGREGDLVDLKYYRARYYHPGLQRFISEDPVGFAGHDVNLYAYVRNNPLLNGDPLGLISPVGGMVVGAVLGGTGGALSSEPVVAAVLGANMGLTVGALIPIVPPGVVGAVVGGLVGAVTGAVIGALEGDTSGLVSGTVAGLLGRAAGGFLGGVPGAIGGTALSLSLSGILEATDALAESPNSTLPHGGRKN